MERLPLWFGVTVEVLRRMQPWELQWPGLDVLLAAQGLLEGVRPGRWAAEELVPQMGQKQQLECCCSALEWPRGEWQQVLDGHVP